MIECKEINEYLDFCKKHPSRINEKRKLLIKNVVKPTLKRSDVYFDSATYYNCLKYCESNYYPLFPYQKFIYAFVFFYKVENNEPLFSLFFIMMGRGNGKDGMIMPLMNFLQTPMYGVKNYHIDIVANSEDQAKNTFKVAHSMLEDSKDRFKPMFKWNREHIENIQTHSDLRFNTSNAKTKDGKQDGCLLFNEVHAYENYDQMNVFTSGMGKIKHGRIFIITTQGYQREGPLDDYLSLCDDILKTGENPLGYFPFICCLDKKEDYNKPKKWELANPSIEFMPVLKDTVTKQYYEMLKLPSKRAEFMTKRMNMPDRDEETTVATWEQILQTTYDDIEKKTPRTTPNLENELCIIGIDYADIRDFASAGLLFKVNGEFIWRQHTWICSHSPFFNSIKFDFSRIGDAEFSDFEIVNDTSLSVYDIVNWCMDKMRTYNVQKIVMDTYRFSLFRQAFERYGIDIETRQNPFGMVRMIRYQSAINTIIAPLIEKSFADNKINFGASAIMRWYTNNTSVTINKLGNKNYTKIEPKLRKNDGFMAFVVAMSCESLLEIQVVSV